MKEKKSLDNHSFFNISSVYSFSPYFFEKMLAGIYYEISAYSRRVRKRINAHIKHAQNMKQRDKNKAAFATIKRNAKGYNKLCRKIGDDFTPIDVLKMLDPKEYPYTKKVTHYQ